MARTKNKRINDKDKSTQNISRKKDKKQGVSLKTPRNVTQPDRKKYEVKVQLIIKSVKYGNKSIESPEVTTLYNKEKTVFGVPFEQSLEYRFEKVEDSMIFKFAITSSGDLLGFLYLEIPQKFKGIKEFKLDDWFPIKKLETEDEKLKEENFMARVIFQYKATRKMISNDLFKTKTGKLKMQEELAKTMKIKLQSINNAIGQYNEEGFKHLDDFEKRMLQKRIKMRAFKVDQNKGKKMAKLYQTEKPLNKEKQIFYRTRRVLAETEDIKRGEINVKDMFKYGKKGGKVESNQFNDKLIKELSYARKELIETKQKLQGLEEGHLSVDNIQLKKKLEQLKTDLLKDKGILAIKLKEQNFINESERKKMHIEFENERDNLEDLQNESRSLILEYKGRLKYFEEKDKELEEKAQNLRGKENNLDKRNLKLGKREDNLKNEKKILNEMNEEVEELKERIMLERRKVFEESENFNFEKGDLDLKTQQVKTQEDFLIKEKSRLEKEEIKLKKQVQKEKDHLKGQRDLLELEYKSLKETKDDYEKRMADLREEKKNLKIERVRLWREKANNQQEVKEFMEWKKIVETENKELQKEIDKDYEFVNDQLSLIEQNKYELDYLQENLENFEKYLEDQHRLVNEQQKRFNIMQAKFFEKLNNSDFDLKELKEYGAQIGIDIEQAEQELQGNRKLQEKLKDEKIKFKKNLEIINNDSPQFNIKVRKSTINNRRQSRISRMSMNSNVIANNLEKQLKIRQEANDIIETIFSNVCLENAKNQERNKSEQIEELRKEVIDLKLTLEDEKAKIKKLKLSHFITSKTKQDIIEIPPVKEKPLSFSQVETEKKAVTIIEPSEQRTQFAQKNRKQKQSMGSLDTLKEPAKLSELKQDVMDICDITIEFLRDNLASAKNQERIQERMKFLEKSKKVLKNIFKILNLIHNAKKDFDNGIIKSLNVLNEDFDFEVMKEKYEAKIKSLVSYIRKIRENNDFFNFNVDNNILLI